jgi:hypothetical protein
MNHLTHQLKKTPEQHFTEIAQTIALASANNIANNVYLEDWSNGMQTPRLRISIPRFFVHNQLKEYYYLTH